MNFAIVNQIVSRAFCWIFLFSACVVEITFVTSAQQDASYFYAVIVWAIAQFYVLKFIEQDSLFYDIRDLCLYEIIFGVIALVAYEEYAPPSLYIPMAYAINFMKFGRLLWPARSQDNIYLTIWPVFGPLGWWARHHNKIPNNVKPSYLQAICAYFYIGACIVLGIFLLRWEYKFKLWQFCILPLIFIPLLYSRIITQLNDLYRRALEAERAAADLQNALRHAEEIKQRENERTALISALQEKDRINQLLNLELQQYNAAIRDANHDLAQPQMHVDACARRLVQAKDETSRKAASHALLLAIAQMGGCVQDTIHNAKIATQMEAPRCEAVDLNPVLLQLTEAWSEKAFEKGIAYFDCHPQGRCNVILATDKAILLRILRNLIVNAILYVPAGGSILIAVRKRHDHCLLQVWDSGPGLPMAQSADGVANFAAFVEWIQRSRMQRQHGGHGLGINNIKQLCNALGTQMEVHSRHGKGTRFSFRLPLADAKLIAATAAASSERHAAEDAEYSQYA